MSRHLAEQKYPKNKIYQYKFLSGLYRVKQQGWVEEKFDDILMLATNFITLT